MIWYQGESNAHNIETHEKLFPLLVQSWRNCFGENLPFYFVQLSSHDRPSWPAFRNSQRLLMNQLENTGMAVCSDFGDKYDVHPRHKKAVGQRLARWALHDLYGFDVIPSGPLFKSIETKDNAIFISFDYAEGLHASDGKALRTFEIAEQEGQFVSANAEIVGNQVKVWNDSIKIRASCAMVGNLQPMPIWSMAMDCRLRRLENLDIKTNRNSFSITIRVTQLHFNLCF